MKEQGVIDLSLIPEAGWSEARRRAEVIRPLAERDRRPRSILARDVWIALIVIAVFATPAIAGPFEDGVSAYERRDFARALQLWQPLADAGNPSAQDRVGRLYAAGEGVVPDAGRAAEWFKKAAEQANPDAQLRLGKYYLSGDGPLQRDSAAGLALVQRAADQGLADAQFALGALTGVLPQLPWDPRKAVFWYRKAADQGMAMAEYQMGRAYNDGRGVEQDFAQAAMWFRKAAEQGDQGGEVGLGRLYAEGAGVPRDKEQALFWLRKATAKGGVPGQVAKQLIDRLETERVPSSVAPVGPGGGGSWEAFMDATRIGAERGNPKDQRALGDLYALHAFGGAAEDGPRAVEWWLRSARQGNVQAMDKLLSAYLLGKLVPRDPTQALHWAMKAAEQDDPVAELQLGEDYAYGVGVTPDNTQAIAWFRKADAHGGIFHGMAERRIADLEKLGRQ